MKKLVLHPFFFILYSVLFLYANNQNYIPLKDLTVPLTSTLFASGLIFAGIYYLVRDKCKTGLIFLFVSLLFFSFGHIHNYLEPVFYFSFITNYGTKWFLTALYVLLSVIFISFILRSLRNYAKLNFILNIMTLTLLILTILQIFFYTIESARHAEDKFGNADRNTILKENANPARLPDIYYIIPDGYANPLISKKLLNFDNHEFTKFLKDHGFYVASKSRCNYSNTLLSLASSLNMEYLDRLAKEVGENSTNLSPLGRMISHSKVAILLKSLGYRIFRYPAGFGSTEKGEYDDAIIFGLEREDNQLSRLMMKMTWLKILPYKEFNFKRAVVPYAFSKLVENRDYSSPKFVFVHLMSPHPPFVFGADGETIDALNDSLGIWDSKENYINEIKFLNKKLEDTTKFLIEGSKTPPVIIIQSDHGTAFKNFTQYSPDQSYLIERSYIFNALLLPRQCSQYLHPAISPVNAFRIVFICVFGKRYELLKDDSYWFNGGAPFKFIRTTERLRKIDKELEKLDSDS
jgi:hypothetical protein